jgi:tetratricopeptide (TPR) repeat protein
VIKQEKMTKNTFAFASLCIIMTLSQASFSQATKQEKAREKGLEAIKLMDNGEFEKSLKLLEEAKKLDPKNIDYPYEIAFAAYLQKDYPTAIKKASQLTKHQDANDRVYQILGNSYSLNNQREKAIETYEKGLAKFPKSGRLHLERGNMELFVQEYEKALSYYEKGIAAEPEFPSNYYWTSKIYCSSTEEVWGMIYGEIFMNMERNSKRTAEISRLLYDTYKNEIKFEGDSTGTVSFCQQMFVSISPNQDPDNLKLPFCLVYEPMLMMSILFHTTINLTTLNQIRSSFIEQYYSGNFHQTHPNVLFDYQKKIKDLGHLEAYNHWILMKGDEDAFIQWRSSNPEKWDAFINWFVDNGLRIDKTNKFHRTQY